MQQQFNFTPKLSTSDRQAIVDAYGKQDSKVLAATYGITYKYVQDIWIASGKSAENKEKQNEIKKAIIALQGKSTAKAVALLFGKKAGDIYLIWSRYNASLTTDLEQPACASCQQLVQSAASGNMMLAVLGFDFHTKWT